MDGKVAVAVGETSGVAVDVGVLVGVDVGKGRFSEKAISPMLGEFVN